MSLAVANDVVAASSSTTANTINASSCSSTVCGYTLQINENLSQCPFVHKPFTIQLYLLDEKKQLVLGRGNIPLDLQLFYQGTDTPIPTQDICNIEPSTLVINNMGILEVQVTFLQLSMHHNNCKFFFRFSIKNDILLGSSTNPSSLTPPALSMDGSASVPVMSNVVEDITSTSVTTSASTDLSASHGNASTANANANCEQLFVCTPPLHVVRLRLIANLEVRNSLAFGPEEPANLPNQGLPNGTKIWYKDEGGKDHGFDLNVMLVDDEGGVPVLQQQPVPFVLNLLYSNGDVILNKPNLLGILPENSQCIIDRNSGRSWKKIRINDISKNHQRQSFIVRVSPDITKNPYLFDIAGDDTVPIEVRSKRTKKQRETAILAAGAQVPGDVHSEGEYHAESANVTEVKQSTKKHVVSSSNMIVPATTATPTPSQSAAPSIATIHPAPVSVPTTSSQKKSIKVPTAPALAPTPAESDGHDQISAQDIHQAKRQRLTNSNPIIPQQALFPPQCIPQRVATQVNVGRPIIYPTVGSSRKAPELTNTSHCSTDNLDHAVQVLLTWTEHVLKAFDELRWQHIGFQPSERDPHQPDTSRPLYNMPNPNASFDRLQQEYKNQVFDSLNAIISGAPKVYHINNDQTLAPPTVTKGNKRETKSNANGGTASKRGSKKKDAQQQPSTSVVHESTPVTSQDPALQFLPHSSIARPSFSEHTTHSGHPVFPYQNYPPYVNPQLDESMNYAAMFNQTRSNSLAVYPTSAIHPSGFVQHQQQQQQQQQQQHQQHATTQHSRTPLAQVPVQTSDHQEGDESAVYYIVAIPYDLFRNTKAASSGDMELFFPAYDVQQGLVGFYTEMKDDRNATIIHFYPLTGPLPFNSQALISSVIDMVKAKQFLTTYLYSPSHNPEDDCSDEVYSLPRAGYNLESMKHDAMVHYWLAEVGLDDF